jgi:uncharacterized protein
MSMERRTGTGEANNQPPTTLAGDGKAVPFPEMCGDFSMRIDRNGTWYCRGSPIGRHALVKLFSTVLRRDQDGLYWLTTPVENGRIEVDDSPFVAVELIAEGAGRNQIIRFRTNVDDIVTLDTSHALRVVHDPASSEPRPYVHVRKGLEARLARAVYYHLVEIGEIGDDGDIFGVWSCGQFFALGSLTGAVSERSGDRPA